MDSTRLTQWQRDVAAAIALAHPLTPVRCIQARDEHLKAANESRPVYRGKYEVTIEFGGRELECRYEHDEATPRTDCEPATPERVELVQCWDGDRNIRRELSRDDVVAIERLVLQRHREDAEERYTARRIAAFEDRLA